MGYIVSAEVEDTLLIRELTRIMVSDLPDEALTQVIAVIGPMEEEIIKASTPVDSGDLADSTRRERILDEDGVIEVDYYQDAASRPNEDGSGGGDKYWYWVAHGHAEISPNAQGVFTGPYSTGKRALANREKGFGPVQYVRATEGVDYPHIANVDHKEERKEAELGAAFYTTIRFLRIVS